MHTECMRKEDVIGISTLVFTPKGEAFYLASSSEVRHEMVDNAPVPVKKDSTASRKVIEVPVKKTSTSEDDTEAATVARQNQLNEQQAQGSKSPVTNGTDPHNETTVSEISADITIDSVKDHTVSQQQLLDSTMTSTTSKSSITAVKTTETIAEEPEEAPKTNGDSEE